MSKTLLILLPPSEGKAEGGHLQTRRDEFGVPLRSARSRVIDALGDALKSHTSEELQRIFRTSGSLYQRAFDAAHLLVEQKAPVMPAWQRYSGVVWEHLDPGSLPAPTRTQILVPSAVYGLTCAEDDIADYRLTMHVSLAAHGNLARYWARHLTEVLRAYRPRTPVVNLLPNEHVRAIDCDQLPRLVHVRFVTSDGAGAAGHAAKAVKGRFARHLLDYGLDEVASFRYDGWQVMTNDSGIMLRAPK